LRSRLMSLHCHRRHFTRHRTCRLNVSRSPDRNRRRPRRTLLLCLPRSSIRSRLRRCSSDRTDRRIHSRRRGINSDPYTSSRESPKAPKSRLSTFNSGSTRARFDRKLFCSDQRFQSLSRFSTGIAGAEQSRKHLFHEFSVAGVASHATVEKLLPE
jgi:hypothetical protein